MNSTECCRTIGCNCGGTIGIEFLNNPKSIMISIIIAVILIIIVHFYLKTKYKEDQYETKQNKL